MFSVPVINPTNIQLAQVATPFNLSNFDSLVRSFYAPSTTDVENQQKVNIDSQIRTYLQRNDLISWIFEILEKECANETKFVYFIEFNRKANEQWETLEEGMRNDIKQLLFGFMKNLAANDIWNPLLTQVDMCLITIAKYEYPAVWPSFVNDILGMIPESDELAANSLRIISLTSQEIVDFADSTLTADRATEMVDSFTAELQTILANIINTYNSPNEFVVKESLDLLKSLVRWIDFSYIFNGSILSDLCERFLKNPIYSPYVIGIFCEIVSLSYIPEDFHSSLPTIFAEIVNSLTTTITEDYNFQEADNSIVLMLSDTIPNFLEQYSELIEVPEYFEYLSVALKWILNLTDAVGYDYSEQSSNFESCVDFWYRITQRVYSDLKNRNSKFVTFYISFLPDIRKILIDHIVSPLEILNIDENGNQGSIKLKTKNNFGDLYSTIQGTLVYLTNIDSHEMIGSLEEKRNQFNETNIDAFNQFCWSLAATAPALSEQRDRTYIDQSIRWLFHLYEETSDYDTKTIIAQNASFISSSITKFMLRDNHLFMNVVDQIILFMKENNPSLQLIAANTLKVISKHNQEQLIKCLIPDTQSYLQNILDQLESLIVSLPSDSSVVLFEVIASLIKCVPNEEVVKNQMIEKLFAILDLLLKQVISELSELTPEVCQKFKFIIDCHQTTAINLGQYYLNYFIENAFASLNQQYKATVTLMSEIMQNRPQDVFEFNAIHEIMDSILSLFDRTIFHCHDIVALKTNLLPIFLEEFLDNYILLNPEIKSPKMLAIFGSLCTKCRDEIADNLVIVWEKLYEPIKAMIFKPNNFDDFYSFRAEFYYFLTSLVKTIPIVLIQIPQEKLEEFIQVIEFGAKHKQHAISEIGIHLIQTLIAQFESVLDQDSFDLFLQQYVIRFFIFALQLLTDTQHNFAFSAISSLIEKIISIPAIKNHAEALVVALIDSFPSRTPEDHVKFLELIFSPDFNMYSLRNVLKDFMVNIRHVLAQDPALREEEKKVAQEHIQQILQEKNNFNNEEINEQEVIFEEDRHFSMHFNDKF